MINLNLQLLTVQLSFELNITTNEKYETLPFQRCQCFLAYYFLFNSCANVLSFCKHGVLFFDGVEVIRVVVLNILIINPLLVQPPKENKFYQVLRRVSIPAWYSRGRRILLLHSPAGLLFHCAVIYGLVTSKAVNFSKINNIGRYANGYKRGVLLFQKIFHGCTS